jgi:hypothetical protein
MLYIAAYGALVAPYGENIVSKNKNRDSQWARKVGFL